VDVYPNPINVNEDSYIDVNRGCHYGRNRLQLEKFVEARFDSLIIRLPGLFGNGLKKNVIYDLINNNLVDQICPESIYQFYHIDNLWRDIEMALMHNLTVVNFATEPVTVKEIVNKAFGLELRNNKRIPPVSYDFQTKYSRLFNCSRGYIYLKHDILSSLENFVSSAKNQIP